MPGEETEPQQSKTLVAGETGYRDEWMAPRLRMLVT